MKKKLLIFSLIIIAGLFILFPQKIKDLQSSYINHFTDTNDNNLTPKALEKTQNSPTDTSEVSSISPKNDLFTPDFWQNATTLDLEKQLSSRDVKKRNSKGVSLLMYASSISNNIHTIDILLNRGASIHTRDEQGRNALMYAAAFNSDPHILKFLLYRGAKIDATDKNGRTALMHAAIHNPNPKIIQELINNKAEIDKRIPHVQTQMTRATLPNKFVMVVKIGLKEAKDLMVNIISRPFEEKSEDSPNLFDTLSNSIDSLSAKIINKEEGMTALMFAAKYSSTPAILETLINNGADVKLYDNTGQTALDYAKNNKAIFDTDIYWKMNDMLYESHQN